ncbi:MAG TPA: DUF1549 domain-containing protein [Chthoniobacteraceae bacterium]|jgi:hypothetical protein|nr:DUF1549 domain-containing protein [Chthoniobacteraceae bacterium]
MKFSRSFCAVLATVLVAGALCPADAAPNPRRLRRLGEIPAPATPAPVPAPAPVAPKPAPARVAQTKQSPAQVAAAAAQIDKLVLAGLGKAGQHVNAPATDDQIVRRMYLDLAGRIPTAEETSAFIYDKAPDKRAKLVDQLIGSAGYNSQMFNWLGDMLRVIDDNGKGVKTYVYEEWLKDQIAENRPWNELVHDLLTAQGKFANDGPVGYLLRDKGMPLDSLSNTLTIFLGANVACAQCHNHPLAAWTQKDFYQMAAYFGAINTDYPKAQKVAKGITGKKKTETDVNRQVLTHVISPNVAAIEELHKNKVTFPSDYKYDNAKPGAPVAPQLIAWSEQDKNSPAYVPTPQNPDELRTAFADWLTHAENPRFATTIANRLWKRAFGMAVLEPVTDLDDLNKAANPELLAFLTSEMKRVHFDLREFQRIVFNSQTYQRMASTTPDLASGPYLFPGPLLRRMTAEQTWDSVLTLVVGPQVDQYKLERADAIKAMNITAPKLTPDVIMAKVEEVEKNHLLQRRRGGQGGGGKKGGNPDPIPADYEGEPPPRFEGMTMARASELPQPAREAHFLRMFGQSDKQLTDGGSTEGGVPQVLMMMNGDVQKVIGSNASSVLRSAAKASTPELKVESLYFSFLGRRPTLQERQIALGVLTDGLKLADLTWILFNSREFIFVQ